MKPHPEIEELLREGIEARAFAGAAYAVISPTAEVRGYVGTMTYESNEPIQKESLFDLASLTKVLVTTTSALCQASDGALNLNDRVQQLVPEFLGEGKDRVTIRHLLQHNSGLPPHRDFWKLPETQRWEAILNEPLEALPGQRTAYSCVGFLVLQQVIQSLTGEHYDDAWTWPFHRVASALGADVLFNPSKKERCVPTEGGLQGVVHDENSRSLGGMTGNAGLFGTLDGVTRFARLFCTGEPSVINHRLHDHWRMQQPAADPTSTRALGWDTRSPSLGSLFGIESYGHTGFTGTSIFIDPKAQVAAVLLTNRIYPTRENARLQAIRPRFHDLAHKLLAS
ncbi:MAG: beta-lactamase family protein [Chthonomonas sp.]|nr:beta-lactamase family protein [Chthonomonas sp.]